MILVCAKQCTCMHVVSQMTHFDVRNRVDTNDNNTSEGKKPPKRQVSKNTTVFQGLYSDTIGIKELWDSWLHLSMQEGQHYSNYTKLGQSIGLEIGLWRHSLGT